MTRPILKLERSPNERLLEILAFAAVAALWIDVLRTYNSLPAVIPRHFNAAGLADGWGPKSLLLHLPAVATALYLMLTVLQRFPHRYNYIVEITDQNAAVQYRMARRLLAVLKTVIVATFFYLAHQTAQVAIGTASGLGGATIFVIIGLAAVPLFVYIRASLAHR